ncbi:MAG: hypothetical protein AABW87_03935, partial [Nanoarchaeota archaeon]
TNFTLRNLAYTNGTLQLETIQSANFTKGQTWRAQINLSDGASNIFINTSELLILNTAPGFFTLPIINSTNGLNTTEQDLNAFFRPNETDTIDSLTYDVVVMMNNITNYTLTNIATTNGTLTVHIINNRNTTKGQTWRAEFRISDGTANTGYFNTSEILILNNASTITQPAFNQTSYKVEENINVSLVTTDIDLDLSNVTFEWFRNNVSIRRTTNNNLANNTNTTDTLAAYTLSKGQTIIVQAFAFDATSNSTLINSTELLIGNSAPTFLVNPTINSTDGTNRTTINLQATFTANDTNSDTLTYSIQYFTNNRSNFTLSGITANRNVITVNNLISNNLTKGQTWKAQVQLSDGTDTSSYVNTSELLILNTQPAFQINPVINSTDGLNRTITDLNVFFTPNETDVNDRLNYSVQVFRNNATNFTLYNIATTNGTFTNFVIQSRNLTKGQTWHVQVWINDGTDNSTLVNTTEILILNSNPQFKNNPIINSTLGTNLTLQDLNVFFTPEDNDTSDTLTYSIEAFTNNRTNFTISSISTTNGTRTNFIINNVNTSKTQTWRAQVRISDGTGNSDYVNTSELLILNTIPGIPTLQLPQNGTWRHNQRWQLYDNNTLFTWNTTDDDPEDTLTYELQVSNISLSERSFRNEFLFRNISLSRTRENITIEEIATNFTIAEHTWRVRAYDNTDYSNWSQNNTFEIVYAVINITSPKDDAVLEILTSQTIQANELANPGWINNATIKFIGDSVNNGLNFTMSNTTNTTQTNYTHSYSVPDVSSRFVTIAVYGNNASLSANDTLRVRITKPLTGAITDPKIVSIITDPTTVEVNTSLNITVNSDLSVLLDTINVSYKAPNGSTNILAVT